MREVKFLFNLEIYSSATPEEIKAVISAFDKTHVYRKASNCNMQVFKEVE